MPTLINGDARAVMMQMPENYFDSVVCDPPYHTELGAGWDRLQVSFRVVTWAEVLRVLKPGGHIFAFGDGRTIHRMATAMEDAGLEIRTQFAWLYGSGMPKNLEIRKRLEDELGLEEFGISVKPAMEPICVARKPLSEPTIVANVRRWGTGALNIGAAKIDTNVVTTHHIKLGSKQYGTVYKRPHGAIEPKSTHVGRWPSNVAMDEEAAIAIDQEYGEHISRFFYCPKPDKLERGEYNTHQSVKPIKLMQWLCRLATPPGGRILDPFMGSGSTCVAAMLDEFESTGVELVGEFFDIAKRRVAEWKQAIREETTNGGTQES